MIAVCDMGPLHYLVLIGAEHVLPQMFGRVLTPPAVLAEMSHPDTPVTVRGWAAAPPPWLEVKDPTQVEDIPSLGRKGSRGAGEKAAIALAREERADVIGVTRLVYFGTDCAGLARPLRSRHEPSQVP
jgi:predicted nucleic acid-binding protein